ncbi:MAG: hypothetical protein WCZ89_07420 [Phycisphaerae bacterium]
MAEEFNIEKAFEGCETDLLNHRILFLNAIEGLHFYFVTLEDFFEEQEKKNITSLDKPQTIFLKIKEGIIWNIITHTTGNLFSGKP